MTTLLCVGLSPSLDRYVVVPAFHIGSINRPTQVTARAGGKALNVARAAAALGVHVVALALLGGSTGHAIEQSAAAEGLTLTAVQCSAETRHCQVILDEQTRQVTEIYEPTLRVDGACWPRFLDAYRAQLAMLRPGDLVVLSGRVPPGLPDSALHELTVLAHKCSLAVAIDSDGPALARALEAAPELIKINVAEAAAVLQWPVLSADLGEMVCRMKGLGPLSVIITHGASGVIGVDCLSNLTKVHHEPVADAIPVGSGDAFLAGVAAVYLNADGAPVIPPEPSARFRQMLIVGARAGRANARQLLAGQIDWPSVDRERDAVDAD